MPSVILPAQARNNIGRKIFYMEKQPSFEASIARLEEIARIMESGDITLEESIKLYEEGMRLAGFCGEQLKNAEEKIITLSDLTGEEG